MTDTLSLTRRRFHQLALAGLMAGLARPSFAATQDPADLYLNRLTFGANDAARVAFNTIGLTDWLDTQLAMPADTPEIRERLQNARLQITYEAGEAEAGTYQSVDERRPFQHLWAEAETLAPLVSYDNAMDYAERSRPADEVVAASLIRAVHDPAQLREVMTQFWHNHFSVNAFKDERTTAFFSIYDRNLRQHALGNFREMLEVVAMSPPMLRYLNNDESRASPANENYARELMELHTLGAGNYLNDLYDDWRAVPGATEGQPEGYIDQDVYEAARAFTGWSLGDGRWIDDGVHAPETGEFNYVAGWHDPYQKRVLGVEFPPNAAPLEDGRRVLGILAAHPGTARFVSGKIMRTLGIEAPSDAYKAAIADVFHTQHEAPDQIVQTIRAIVLHPEFSSTPPQKLRRPFELLAALYRASGAEVTDPQRNWIYALQRAGWMQHAVRPPNGHSDDTAYWANTRALNGMIHLILSAHEDWFEVIAEGHFDVPDKPLTWGNWGSSWMRRINGNDDGLDDWVTAMGINPAEPLPTSDPGWTRWAAASAIAVAAVSPDFMMR